MNRTSPGLSISLQPEKGNHNNHTLSLLVSKAIPGFIQFKSAEGLSPRTLVSYEHDLNLWLEIQGDRELNQVTTQELREYLHYMRTEYTPRRITGNNNHKLSRKTIRNIWISLSAFFSWASEEFDFPNPMKGVPAPKYARAQVETFIKDEIEALLKACEYCREAVTDQRRKFTIRRPTARRDRAIILTLLDTGLRAGVLCSLRIGDVDLKSGKVVVRHGIEGGSKGGKDGFIFIMAEFVCRSVHQPDGGKEPLQALIQRLVAGFPG